MDLNDLPKTARNLLNDLLLPELQNTNLGAVLILFERPSGHVGLSGTQSHAEHAQLLMGLAQLSEQMAKVEQVSLPPLPFLWRRILPAEA